MPPQQQQLQLSSEEVEMYLATGKATFRQLIDLTKRRQVHGTQYQNMGISNCVARATLQGTLAEIRDLFEGDDNMVASSMKLESTLILASLSDEARLRWTFFASKLPAVMRHRDLCYVEYMDTFSTQDGRKGLARAVHSVNLANGPVVPGCIRAQLYPSGYVFVETDVPGVLEVTLVLRLAFGGHVPGWLIHTLMQSRVQHIHKFNDILQDHRQLQLRASQRNKCQRCSKSASGSLFRSRGGHTCTSCFQLFCDDCIPSESNTCIGCSLNVYSPTQMRDSIYDGTAFRGHGRSVDLTLIDQEVAADADQRRAPSHSV